MKLKFNKREVTGRIEGTRKIKARYDVLCDGAKVGEIRKVQFFVQLMEGRLRAGLRNDFTAWYVYEGAGEFPREIGRTQEWSLRDAKAAAERHFTAKVSS